MSAATQNYVEQLQNDLKRSQWRVDALEATIGHLENQVRLHELNEARLLARLKKQSHICTAGNNGDLPGEMG